jgi:hypothetical protein
MHTRCGRRTKHGEDVVRRGEHERARIRRDAREEQPIRGARWRKNENSEIEPAHTREDRARVRERRSEPRVRCHCAGAKMCGAAWLYERAPGAETARAPAVPSWSWRKNGGVGARAHAHGRGGDGADSRAADCPSGKVDCRAARAHAVPRRKRVCHGPTSGRAERACRGKRGLGARRSSKHAAHVVKGRRSAVTASGEAESNVEPGSIPSLHSDHDAELADTQTSTMAEFSLCTVKRSEKVWFEDGNIVLQAEDTVFRVHKGFLASNSSVFHTMLALPQPVDLGDETYGGCSLVQMPESSYDLGEFLQALCLQCVIRALCTRDARADGSF